MPTLKVWPASEAAALEAAVLEAAEDAVLPEAEPPHPVRPSAERAAAAAVAFRKLRREIRFMVFIAVLLSLERAANRKTRSTCGTGSLQSQNDPVPVCSSTRTGSIKYDSAVPPCLLCIVLQQSPSRRANTPLPCNGGFRPKLLRKKPSRLPGPRRPTNFCPACRPFPSSGLSCDALCRFSSASSV